MNSRRLGRWLGPRQVARLNPPGDGRGKGIFGVQPEIRENGETGKKGRFSGRAKIVRCRKRWGFSVG